MKSSAISSQGQVGQRKAAGKTPHARKSGVADHLARALQPLLRQPARSLALLLAGSLSGYALVNAVAMQTGRHPAPLFASFTEAVAPAASGTSPQAATSATHGAVPPAKRGADINTLLTGRRDAATAPVPLPRPKQPPSASRQSAGSSAAVR